MVSIVNNLLAMNASRLLNVTGTAISKSSKRLSGGYRINSAADDAAGLAISERMRAQIRGLHKADGNIRDGINLTHTADGGMNEISEMLTRQRELIIQGLNDTNNDDDKKKIQTEIEQLITEIDSISNRTEYNTIVLLNGSSSISSGTPGISTADALADFVRAKYASMTYSQKNALIGTSSAGTVENIRDWVTSILPAGYRFSDGPSFDSLSHNPAVYLGPSFVNNVNGLNDWFANVYFTGDLKKYNLTNVTDAKRIEKEIRAAFLALPPGDPARSNGADFTTWFADMVHSYGVFQIQVPAYMFNSTTSAAQVYNWMTGGEGLSPAPSTNNYFTSCNISGLTWADLDTYYSDSKGQLWIQTGANEMQGMYIDLYDCRSKTLGIQGISLDTIEEANKSLKAIDDAINTVTDYRATCGAQQNRLEYAMNVANNSADNTEDALSRISDTDMAKEMMAHSRATVLMQAGVAMLAQARQQPEMVLQLLR